MPQRHCRLEASISKKYDLLDDAFTSEVNITADRSLVRGTMI
jgi:hypothetical protein